MITPEKEKTDNSPCDFTSDIVSDMPQVSAAAPTIAQKHLNKTQENIPNESTIKKPGRGRPRKDGKPAQSNPANKNGSRLGGVADTEQRNNAALDAQRLAAAQMLVSCVEMSGYALGDQAALMSPPEKEGMSAVYDNFLKSKNLNDIPPGVALLLVTGQYYARVLATPKAQPKVRNFVMKIRDKIRDKRNARAMRRNDRERENNAGEATDTSIQSEGDKN